MPAIDVSYLVTEDGGELVFRLHQIEQATPHNNVAPGQSKGIHKPIFIPQIEMVGNVLPLNMASSGSARPEK